MKVGGRSPPYLFRSWEAESVTNPGANSSGDCIQSGFQHLDILLLLKDETHPVSMKAYIGDAS